ncbi:multiple epidermal growth factor domains protein 6, partial [Biomphalaria glabrata]
MIRKNVSLVKIVLYILSYIVALGYCRPQTPIKCPKLMFGDYCAFKCHCRNDQCKPSGSCRAKYDCAKPYFGYKCQMVDLAPQAKEKNFLNDYNEKTCGVRGNKGPITLSFDKPYRFTHAYMRFKTMYRSLSYLKYDIQIKLKTGGFNVDCGPLEVRELSATDAELRCKNVVMDFDMISLEGEGVQFLCSFHISRGRNIIGVANLTKWYKDDGARPEKIRDGDTGLNNCFMACHYDEKMHVKFSWRQEYILHRIVIYNQH